MCRSAGNADTWLVDSRPPTSNSCIQFVRVDNLSTSALFHRVDVVWQQSITINVTEVLHYSSHIGNIPTRVRRHFNLGSAIDRRPSNQIFYRLHWSSTLIWMFSARCQVLLCSWVTVGFQKRRDQPGRRFTLSERKKLGNCDYQSYWKLDFEEWLKGKTGKPLIQWDN